MSTSCTRARRDTLIALDDRGRIANRHGGDLFISIHVNAANLELDRPRRRARLRDVLSLRGAHRRRAPRRAHGKRRRPLRADRARTSTPATRSASFSATCSRTSTCANRASWPRSFSTAWPRCTRAEPRRQAGGVSRARDGVHAGGARRDRIRHQSGARRAISPIRPSRTRSPPPSPTARMEYLDAYERRVDGGKAGTGGSQNR